MKFDKTQKRALVFVAGLLGLSWYMGGQYEKADMMRSEADAYTYAYNEGHSDSRKDEDYQPALTSGREEARFRKILKQRAETFMPLKICFTSLNITPLIGERAVIP